MAPKRGRVVLTSVTVSATNGIPARELQYAVHFLFEYSSGHMAIPITSTALAGVYFITDIDACVMSTLAREDWGRDRAKASASKGRESSR